VCGVCGIDTARECVVCAVSTLHEKGKKKEEEGR